MRLVKKTYFGQTLLEYIILIGIIVTVLVAMSPYLKRGIQSVIRVTADQLQFQNEAEQSLAEGVGSSYLMNSFTTSNTYTDKLVREVPGGKTSYIYDGDHTEKITTSLTNLGFYNRSE